MSSPLISIITVVYNDLDHIESTIQSVNLQQFKNFEYIIIDGGSKDGTIEKIQKYKENLTHFISESDKGIYNAMNKGIALARGEYSLFLNSGDLLINSRVLEEFSPILTQKKFDIVYGDVLTIDKYGKTKLRLAEKPGNKHRMYFCHQSAFISTELLKINPYDESYKMSADFKFFKIIYKNGAIFQHVNKPVSIFNTFGISKTNRLNSLKENIKVILEVDKGITRILIYLRIFPSFFIKWIIIKFKILFVQKK